MLAEKLLVLFITEDLAVTTVVLDRQLAVVMVVVVVAVVRAVLV